MRHPLDWIDDRFGIWGIRAVVVLWFLIMVVTFTFVAGVSRDVKFVLCLAAGAWCGYCLAKTIDL